MRNTAKSFYLYDMDEDCLNLVAFSFFHLFTPTPTHLLPLELFVLLSFCVPNQSMRRSLAQGCSSGSARSEKRWAQKRRKEEKRGAWMGQTQLHSGFRQTLKCTHGLHEKSAQNNGSKTLTVMKSMSSLVENCSKKICSVSVKAALTTRNVLVRPVAD